MTEIVAGVDDQVGREFGQTGHPLLLAVLPRCHMGVGDVEDAQRLRPLREHPQRVVPHREQVALDADAPDRGPDGRRPRDPEGREGGGHERARHGHALATTDSAIAVFLFADEPPAGLVPVTWPSAGALASVWHPPIEMLL